MAGNDRAPANAAEPPDKPAEARSRAPYVLGAIVVLAFVAIGLPRCGWVQKAKLDREVDRLCAIDGGVHIYEVVRLPKEDFGPDGTVFPPYRNRLFSAGRYGDEYVGRIADKTLVSGNPSLVRMNTLIVRLFDNKVLGEVVIYRRSGGGGPGLSERSEHSCPKGPVFGLESQVFKPQEN
jgi:hypothetical protein